MFQALAANLTFAMTSLMAWMVLGEYVARLSPRQQRLVFTATMAVSTLTSMALSVQLSPGVYFDLRAPLIALSAFFGGLPAAVLVGSAALAYRLWLGGALLVGTLSIVSALFVGMVGYWLCRTRRRGLRELAGLSCAIAVHHMLIVLALPPEVRALWVPQMWSLVTLVAFSTFAFGGLLFFEQRRRELAALNAHYRAMVEALPDCLNIKDAEGRFMAANEATAQLMGAPSAAALIGKSDFDFYPVDLARQFRNDEGRVMVTGRHETIEQERRFADGSVGWLCTLKAPVRDERGQAVAIVTHNRDITTTKMMQAKLADTQGYLDEALANMSDGLAMYDAQDTMLFCNKRYQELFPATAHMRIPGAQFADLMRAAVLLGEERLAPGTSLHDHIAAKLATLRRDQEVTVTLADGRVFACQTRLTENGCSLRIMSDVTARHSFEKQLEWQALHDPLTGLANRACFDRELGRLFAKAEDERGELIVMLIDLDHFKHVNDTYGHPAGDSFLIEVSRRLERSVRQGDLVARFGGDEFAILAYGGTTGVGGTGLADRVVTELAKPVQMSGTALIASGTIGFTVFPYDHSNVDDLLKNADRALYQAKSRRRGTWQQWELGAAEVRRNEKALA